jgi:hypothetical protein
MSSISSFDGISKIGISIFTIGGLIVGMRIYCSLKVKAKLSDPLFSEVSISRDNLLYVFFKGGFNSQKTLTFMLSSFSKTVFSFFK